MKHIKNIYSKHKKALYLIIILFFIQFFISFNKTYAATTYTTPKFGGGPASNITCQDSSGCNSYGNTCNNGPSAGDSGGCGGACQGGNSWSQYSYISCSQITYDPVNENETCQPYYDYTSAVCSTGDKYNSSNPPVMDSGSCSCGLGSGYKTCCNGTTLANANNYPVDNTEPDEADCGGATTVFCGFGDYPPCGQDACNTLATPTPTPSPGQCQYGECSVSTQSPSCASSTSTQTCSFNPSLNKYCFSAPEACTTERGGPVCENGQCVASPCQNNDPCTASDLELEKVVCATDGSNDFKQCFQFGPSTYCWIKNGQTCPTGQYCQNSQSSTPTCVATPTSTPEPTTGPIVTFPPGCFIWQNCNAPGGWQTILTWPIALVQQNWCNPGYACVQGAGSGTQCTTSSCVYQGPVTISGDVFEDFNQNRIQDAAETGYTGSYSISATYTTSSGNGCFGGNYDSCISYCNSNLSTCGNNPASYCGSYCNQGASCCGGSYGTCSSWWCGNQTTCGTTCTGTNPLTTSTIGASISGSHYEIPIPTTSQNNFTVRLTIAGRTLTEPLSGDSFNVSAGSQQGCSTGGSANASCYLGGINNLDFGVIGSNPWIQSQGSDIRNDSGFSNQIPASASCGSVASLPGNGNTPGIIYSGDSAASFGSGTASSKDWTVGGATYPETYSPTRPNLIRTSYNYLTSVTQSANITPTDITAYCSGGGLNNCLLSTSIPNGVYIANGDMTILGDSGTYTFPADKNFVILVNGDLTIKTKILVPTESTATFSTSGDIIIDKSVGQSTITSTSSDIEGFFSTDQNFIVDGANDCTTPDIRLNVAGSVVVNAALGGGTFQNNRTLCGGNNSCPAFFVKERPDFVLNAPDFIKHPSYVYQEAAP